MIVVTEERIFRILIASDGNIKSPRAINDAYFCGVEKYAVHSALRDLGAMDNGACVNVQRWHPGASAYRDIYQWEKREGRAYAINTTR